MSFDFATAMVIALAVSGVIWAVDAALMAPRRRRAVVALQTSGRSVSEEEVKGAGKEPILVEYARSFFPVILIVLMLRSFVVEPFRIPSGSMIPTLLVGDFILVNKFTYGIRLPVVNKKIVELGEPQRGDVVVFRFPQDPSTDYIKRVIGLPGDLIEYHHKTLYINGKAATQKELGPFTGVDTGMVLSTGSLRTESFDGVEHPIVVMPEVRSRLDDGEWRVPEGHYFVMGDNRDNSNDSRGWGFVPEENLVGKAFLIWLNFSSWDRIGTSIQ